MKRTALALLLLLPLSAEAGSRFDDEPDAPAATGFAAILAPANGLLPKGGSTARLFVYRDDGTPFSNGAAAGSYEPGVEVALPPGTYFAEVARTRTGLRVSKFRVELGKTSVIPTGWVGVTAVEPDEQPRLNCQPWFADLTVFERDANGVAKMAQSNSHTEHEAFGALQLPVGPTEVVFNGLPAAVTVKANAVLALPTGFALPSMGGNPQLCAGDPALDATPRINLCTDGGTQVPAGSYRVAATIDTNRPPYTLRDEREVTVETAIGGASRDLQTARLAHRELPDAILPITDADAPALATIRSVGPAPLGGTKGSIRLGGSRKP
ncbi:MAG: hypothetical protein HQ461_02700 [Deltaproteobacteria bacterium]|nr:hypothetical protein [Deltaproteobacteria bacterium]